MKDQTRNFWILAVLIYFVGLGSALILWGGLLEKTGLKKNQGAEVINELAVLVAPPVGYSLPVSYGDFAPRLVQVGVIDYTRFEQLYKEIGSPLTDQQKMILTEGSDDKITIDRNNQHFLLNLFWALGLANQNRLLTAGSMGKDGRDGAMGFASTGGWSLSAKPVVEIYASLPLVPLTDEQQAMVEGVAAAVYRPCCGNPTSFPDCNHGMAMLGLLEWMAFNGVDRTQMFDAAKYFNAFWFPQQMLEVALYLNSTSGVSFEDANAEQIVGKSLFSGSGYQGVHQWLADNGKLEAIPNNGASCGVR